MLYEEINYLNDMKECDIRDLTNGYISNKLMQIYRLYAFHGGNL